MKALWGRLIELTKGKTVIVIVTQGSGSDLNSEEEVDDRRFLASLTKLCDDHEAAMARRKTVEKAADFSASLERKTTK